MAAPTMSAKEMARQLDTDARTFRKFMRDITPKEDQPGQGKRWTFEGTKKSINGLKKKFAAWQDEKTTKPVETEEDTDADDVEELDIEEEIDDEDVEEEEL